MKILLVRPVSDNSQIIPTLGLGYLATQVKKHGHEAEVLDCARTGLDHNGFRDFLRERRFDIIGIQVFTCDFSSARKMLDIVKEVDREVVTIAGGPHISGLPEHTLRTVPSLDYGFCGEAEIGLPLFCDFISGADGITRTEVPGLVYREGESIRTNDRKICEDLDNLEFPDWDQIDPKTYPVAPHGTFTKRLPVAPIITSRGCPYECAYCGVKSNTGQRLRKRSPANIVAEIELLVSKYGVREIHIEDDNFTFDRRRVMEFCNLLIERRIDISWACPNGVRLDTLDGELLQTMEKAGCYSFAVGIESGSPKILKDMNRKMVLETLKEKVKLIAEATKIRMTGFAMAGYPTETVDDIEKTIGLTLALPIHRVQFSNFLPLPGTRIFNELLECGDISLNSLDWDSFQDNRIVYSPPGMTPETLHRLIKKGFYKFYFRPRIIWGLIREIHSFEQFRIVLKRALDIFR
ncbi:MAG: B12-binding domain-containing radical SAM protein [Proteobacteria bacterium]|nr:B12-binding domain-containing radical SAM protein [Pseudomonadota bacterium]MBU1738392.1 B12-binding domain-containing radical SAM protein [Pseudomonadota bacterium]